MTDMREHLRKARDCRYSLRFGASSIKKKRDCDALHPGQNCWYHTAARTMILPKVGSVRLRQSREDGELKNVALRQERGRRLATLVTDGELEVVMPSATTAARRGCGAVKTNT
jgi:hypothetical protein